MIGQAQRLALWLVPADRRALAEALFELERELVAIPAKVREPTLGLMRIVWWRDAVLALAERPVPAQPLLQKLSVFENQSPDIADWVETFDAPFVPLEEQAGRLAERARLTQYLLGEPAARYLEWVAAHPDAAPWRLAWQALKQI